MIDEARLAGIADEHEIAAPAIFLLDRPGANLLLGQLLDGHSACSRDAGSWKQAGPVRADLDAVPVF